MSKFSKNVKQWLLSLTILSACSLLFVFRTEVAQFLQDITTSKTDVTVTSQAERTVSMRNVLPRDAIPAIDNPQFINVAQANSQYADDELVIGVEINGEARAYSVPYLSSHEIVNDTVGDVPIAVTW